MPKIQKKKKNKIEQCTKIFIYQDLKSLVKHYSFRGPKNNRILQGIDNKLNET